MSAFYSLLRKAAIGLLVSIPVVAVLSSCGDEKHGEAVKVGVMDGEEGDVWKVAAEEAKKDGLDIQLVYFSDYSIPNEALNSGEIAANAFQHQPFLDAQVAQRGYQLSTVGNTLLFPIGVYSHKITDISQLPQGARVGISNDPANGGRALRLFDALGIIKLKDPNNVQSTRYDIAENPKQLDFQEMDPGMLGRMVDDLDVAVVNTNWALIAGLNPENDALLSEPAANNPYNNIIVVRTKDVEEPWVKKLVKAYNSEPVRAEIKSVFGSAAQTAW